MKKNSTCPQSPKGRKARKGPITIGIDLGDKKSRYCVLEGDGNVVLEDQVTTSKKAMAEAFRGKRCRIALEVGTHSRWVSQLLQELGHEVIVANARKLQLISRSSRKDDRLDARLLGEAGESGPGTVMPDPAPKRESTSGSDEDPGASGVGGDAHQPDQHRSRIGQGSRRAGGEVRRRCFERKEGGEVAAGAAARAEAAAAADRMADAADQSL